MVLTSSLFLGPLSRTNYQTILEFLHTVFIDILHVILKNTHITGATIWLLNWFLVHWIKSSVENMVRAFTEVDETLGFRESRPT